MPIPKPNSGEKKSDFVSRCMGDSTMNKEFPSNEQRRAVCERQWEDRNNTDGGERHALYAFHGAADGSSITTGSLHGRDHMVVPVVGLVEGVFHASNIPWPELMPFGAMLESVPMWNGRPVLVNHPERDGFLVSANDPDVHDREVFGTIFNAHITESGKLGFDAWLDLEKAERIGERATEMLARLRRGENVEISTGFGARVMPIQAQFDQKDFFGIIKEIEPDHLALLTSELKGAFSWETGAGAPRVNENGEENEEDAKTEPWVLRKSPKQHMENLLMKIFNRKNVGENAERDKLVEALISAENTKWEETDRDFLKGLEEAQFEKIAALSEASASESEPDPSKEEDKTQQAAENSEESQKETHANTKGEEQPVTQPNKNGAPAVDFQTLLQSADQQTREMWELGMANYRERRKNLVEGIKENPHCSIPEEKLNSMDMETLEQVAQTVQPKNYAAAAGSVSRQPEAERYAEEPISLSEALKN